MEENRLTVAWSIFTSGIESGSLCVWTFVAVKSWTLLGSVSLDEVFLSAPWPTWNLFHNYLQACQSLLVRQKLWRRRLKQSKPYRDFLLDAEHTLRTFNSVLRLLGYEVHITAVVKILKDNMLRDKTSNNIGNLYSVFEGSFRVFHWWWTTKNDRVSLVQCTFLCLLQIVHSRLFRGTINDV